ncbi:uncharacterized protein TNCV_2378741 [Trichonephila clavipes]|uniref:Uncharacterized protein n=1 Tax=Trichonephila clavipes TaxID=2585209 RepID=A0A8X6UVX8_TRICX|nr:uncharacterized protein TNCV_2378741 [Trichonephila clavipes]
MGIIVDLLIWDSSIIKLEPPTPELNVPINDPKRFLLEKIGRIPVTNLESLLKLVQNHPDIGYIPMRRNHMDLVHDYDPYNYTICSFNHIDEENYVTISKNGLVEFYKGDADFLPLNRLQMEQKKLNILKEVLGSVDLRDHLHEDQGSGHPRQTSRREDLHIARNVRVQPTASSAAIQALVAP